MTPLATLHPLPLYVRAEAALDPLEPTRQRLAEAITALEHAHGAVELAAEPVHHLTEILTEHDRLQGQLHELVDRDEKLTGEWLAGGRIGPHPGAAADTQQLHDQIVRMGAEVAAARRTLPVKEQLHRAAIERLGEATAARDAALDEVACVVADAVAGRLTEALNQSLTIEAQLLCVHHALLERARDRTNSGAGHAAERIAVMIRAAKRNAGVPHNSESGRWLLQALATNPKATL
jgi:hypothetical protein